MNNDRFLEQALLDEKLRPMPGHLFCMKQTKNSVVDVNGLGSVTVSEETASGLVIVSKDSKASEQVKALMVTVVAVGADPHAWDIRIPKTKRKQNMKTTWAQQRIQVGTILSIRPIAGVEQTKDSMFLDLRYDEISCIGQPLDDDTVPDMLPAPGWVIVRTEREKEREHACLKISEGLEDILQNGFMMYGTVVGLPRGYDEELVVGDRICFPNHTGVGATEYIEFDGNLRAMPLHDVLGYVEE